MIIVDKVNSFTLSDLGPEWSEQSEAMKIKKE